MHAVLTSVKQHIVQVAALDSYSAGYHWSGKASSGRCCLPMDDCSHWGSYSKMATLVYIPTAFQAEKVSACRMMTRCSCR